jgi:hypothetical protein
MDDRSRRSFCRSKTLQIAAESKELSGKAEIKIAAK